MSDNADSSRNSTNSGINLVDFEQKDCSGSDIFDSNQESSNADSTAISHDLDDADAVGGGRDTKSSDGTELVKIPPKKTFKCFRPEITLVVGSGDNKQAFECYKYELCYYDYFDTMLSSKMKEGKESRIEFPDKDPSYWQLFLDIISPFESTASITLDNVFALAPWFQEFQMSKFLDKCDSIVSSNDGFKSFMSEALNDELKSDDHSGISNAIGGSARIHWKKIDSDTSCVIVLKGLFEYVSYCEETSLETSFLCGMKELEQFFRDSTQYSYAFVKTCPEVLPLIISFLRVAFEKKKSLIQDVVQLPLIFTQEEHENVDWDNPYLPHLINAGLLMKLQAEKAEKKLTLERSIVREKEAIIDQAKQEKESIIQEVQRLPNRLHDELPSDCEVEISYYPFYQYANNFCRGKLSQIIQNSKAFKI